MPGNKVVTEVSNRARSESQQPGGNRPASPQPAKHSPDCVGFSMDPLLIDENDRVECLARLDLQPVACRVSLEGRKAELPASIPSENKAHPAAAQPAHSVEENDRVFSRPRFGPHAGAGGAGNVTHLRRFRSILGVVCQLRSHSNTRVSLEIAIVDGNSRQSTKLVKSESVWSPGDQLADALRLISSSEFADEVLTRGCRRQRPVNNSR